MRIKWIKLCILVLIFESCTSKKVATDQILKSRAESASLFGKNSVLYLALEGPLQQVFDEKSQFIVFDDDNAEWEQQYREGFLQTENKSFPAKMRARGQGTRLGCAFPPLKIKFKASDTKGSFLEGVGGFKTISQCDSDPKISIKYQREAGLYEIAKFLFPHSIDTRILSVKYIDTSNAWSLSQREVSYPAIALEDLKEAAERMKLDVLDLDPSAYETPWYAWDGNEALASLISFYGREKLKKIFLEIKQNNPQMSKDELSKQLLLHINQNLEGFQKELKVHATANLESYEAKTKSLQRDILARTDKSVAFKLVLFNIMIKNNDWNHFGLNPTQTRYALRNVNVFVTQSKSILPSPYDFDLSQFVTGAIPSVQDYSADLIKFLSNATPPLNDFFLGHDLKSEIKSFIDSKPELLRILRHLNMNKVESELFIQTIENFCQALENYYFSD